jgi:hypothetical protein
MMRTILRLTLLSLCAALLCSCSSISVVDTWRNPSLQPVRLHKLLIVSITRKDANRAVYEDVIASELAKHGVEAVASHTIMPGELKGEATILDQAVKKAGADSVLTVQTIKVERQTTVQPGYVNNYPGYWYPEAFPSWDLYGYYGSMASYGPAYISSYDVATIQVNFFGTSTGKLFWAATVSSSEPENIISVAKDLAEMVAKSLAKDGFI